MFADIGDLLGELAVKLLAVAGGAVVGGILTGFLARLAWKGVFRREIPKQVASIVRGVGALACAVLVALLVFSGGGGGFGFGWGLGGGAGKGTGSTTGTETKTGRETAPATTPATRPDTGPESGTGSTPLRVRVLGGGDKEKRFYRIDDEKEPHTLDGLRSVLAARKHPATGKPFASVELHVYPDSADVNSSVVAAAHRLAEDAGLSVKQVVHTTDGG
jgi:hypothetical protein